MLNEIAVNSWRRNGGEGIEKPKEQLVQELEDSLQRISELETE